MIPACHFLAHILSASYDSKRLRRYEIYTPNTSRFQCLPADYGHEAICKKVQKG